MALDLLLAPFALFLTFVWPGLGLSVALFPEKLRRGGGWEGPLEIAVLSVVGSVAVTILLGSALSAGPWGFGASPSDPTLWVLDGVLGAAGIGVGALRAPSEASPPEADDAWDTLRTLEHLAAEERRLRRRLRTAALTESERRDAERALDRIGAERERVRGGAEAGHAA